MLMGSFMGSSCCDSMASTAMLDVLASAMKGIQVSEQGLRGELDLQDSEHLVSLRSLHEWCLEANKLSERNSDGDVVQNKLSVIISKSEESRYILLRVWGLPGLHHFYLL